MRQSFRNLATLVTITFLTLTSSPLWGAVSNCPAGDTSLPCRLEGLLNLLSVTAVILAVLLVLALTAAIWYYRRNRHKDLLPR